MNLPAMNLPASRACGTYNGTHRCREKQQALRHSMQQAIVIDVQASMQRLNLPLPAPNLERASAMPHGTPWQ
jgi:hypothetical protein